MKSIKNKLCFLVLLFISTIVKSQQRVPEFWNNLTPRSSGVGRYGISVINGHIVLVGSTVSDTIRVANFSEIISQSALDGKVDKITGKGLSDNDFTNTYKSSLDNLSTNLSGKANINGSNSTGTWPIAISGNSGSVTNGIYTSSLYPDPSWLTISIAKVTGLTAALAGKEPTVAGGSVGEYYYYNKGWRIPVIGDITGLQLRLNNTAKRDSVNIYTQINTFNQKIVGLDTWSNGQIEIGQPNQAAAIRLKRGNDGVSAGFLGYANANSNATLILTNQGSMNIGSTGLTDISSSGTSGTVKLTAFGASGIVSIQAGTGQDVQVHPSGNVTIAPNGSFVDNSFPLEVIGNARNTGKTVMGSTSLTPTSYLTLAAGTSSANTAPLKFTAGTNMSGLENGAVEYDGNKIYITMNGVRETFAMESDNIISSASTFTIPARNGVYIFTGTTATWTLPPVSGNTKLRIIVVNTGSGNITLNSNVGDADIWEAGATMNSTMIAPGETPAYYNTSFKYTRLN